MPSSRGLIESSDGELNGIACERLRVLATLISRWSSYAPKVAEEDMDCPPR